ncbi:hypothetical protein LOZ53_006361 [Ophidiomyces ophidiicola]|uniref:Uncharacterized protein n=1 Tax=Ophidiomyces ophidiicola TaxID=1387563 RepID=A0ACB8UNS4_9EURO|nr:hypothetical protein LOZ61_006584 [Ophidiomyces ophidiicola]KAI1916571.1 hypothetical protein LOZ64_003320 [Ophidiomyces ophidiicola]KAI1921195.1 hypothetical protein LOZ60_006308 [Ophidiomyces ophidiicola]KAI1947586.1 hypothetical protein LOZ62_002950 [Ophidiomyces ophidiicola]KAI1957611.1 hypothetical protein LOZ59_003827 [Ophidiomyces ophidiicola]
MAKGARSSVKKRNKAKLRATVFGPVVDRRTERLSAKLQDLASAKLVKDADMVDAEINLIDPSEPSAGKATTTKDDMDIDQSPDSSKPKSSDESGRTGRIQKRPRRKTRPSITFKPHPRKVKKTPKRK